MTERPYTVVVLADTPTRPCALALKSPDGILLGLAFDGDISQEFPGGDVVASLSVEGKRYVLRNPRLCVREGGQESVYREAR